MIPYHLKACPISSIWLPMGIHNHELLDQSVLAFQDPPEWFPDFLHQHREEYPNLVQDLCQAVEPLPWDPDQTTQNIIDNMWHCHIRFWMSTSMKYYIYIHGTVEKQKMYKKHSEFIRITDTYWYHIILIFCYRRLTTCDIVITYDAFTLRNFVYLTENNEQNFIQIFIVFS